MINLSARTAGHLRAAARAAGFAGVLTFWVLAIVRGLPHGTEGDVLGVVAAPTQLSMLAVLLIGWLLTFRWHATGAAVVAVGAAGLGILATVQYPPVVALAVTVALALPAVVFWTSWQRTRTFGSIAGLALVTALLLTTETVAAQQLYDKFYGPKHPKSTAAVALKSSAVDWFWSGAVTSTSASVSIKTRHEKAAVRVRATAVGQSTEVASPVVAANRHLANVALANLEPATEYRYAIEVDGVRRAEATGGFRTSANGADSFRFAVSACARTGSNGSVFDAIAATDPRLFVVTGDIHYANITSNQQSDFENALTQVLRAPAQQALHRSVPVAYVWDDHDYGANDADRRNPAKAAATAAYEATVPHYPLAVPGTVAQAFTVGRVRFIVTDTRSQKSPASEADGPAKTMLGEAQKAWWKREMLAARDAAALTVWVNPDPWIGAAGNSESWRGYATERRELSTFLADNAVRNVLMVAGDAHMVAIDDGSNTDYSGTGRGGFPLLHAAALDRPGNVKGGPYSHGAFGGAGQFGLVDVKDDGTDVRVTLEGRTWDGRVLTSYAYTVPR
jgi:phosphodiesterase/alkaline phosphatase D-like protein